MSTHTMELEAYGNYARYCATVDVRPLRIDDWRKVSASVPTGWASAMSGAKRTNPGFSIINPQSAIKVSG